MRTRNAAVLHKGSAERTAMGVVVLAMAAFGVYGITTGSPNTVAYELTVTGVGGLAILSWKAGTPRPLAIALALLAAAHLAGGLVRVGDDVLYNASAGGQALRYDHLVHASAVFVGTVLLWALFVPEGLALRRPQLVALCVLAGLGLGAVNETIEFLATTAHHGSHVGGYVNTGWDLVSNLVGAVGGGLLLRSRSRRTR